MKEQLIQEVQRQMLPFLNNAQLKQLQGVLEGVLSGVELSHSAGMVESAKVDIRMQRNKLYAHNDEQRILSKENPTDRHPIFYPDVQEMIAFALDCTGLILGVLTDVTRATQYSNIDDWEGTLMLARLGLKYQEYDFQQSEKAFEAEMQRQLGGNDNGELQ